MAKDNFRIDKFLWSIRFFKTRGAAIEACKKGKVKLKEKPIKPSAIIEPGQVYEVIADNKKSLIKIGALLEKRVGAKEATDFYELIHTEDIIPTIAFQPESFQTGKRQSKIGRPTKKNRRDMTDFTNT